MKLLKDIEVSGKRVFLRGDLDVDVEQLTVHSSQLTEATRLQNLKPTVDYLVEHGAKQIVIAGHIGRPENRKVGDIGGSDKSESQITQKIGAPEFYEEKLSTKNLVPVLEKLLGKKIAFSEQLTVDSLQLTKGSIVLLENLRFWEGEEKNDPKFARQLANLADVYVNDAFGVCHRAHASIVGVPGLLPHAAGLHLQEEVNKLMKSIKNPQRPMVAIVGGEKLETKVPVIEHLAEIADSVLVGGLIAKQLTVNSKVIVAKLTENAKDISDESIEKFKEIIKSAKTVVWNGPMGYFEGGYERGTMAVCEAIINSGAYSVVGGGETTQFLVSKNLLGKFSFISSGGGAMLEFLSGKELPGIVALQ